jgi:hypothetical protein
VAELLPVLAEKAQMELVRPIRAERRSREELEAYLRFKLEEELPPEEAARLTKSYALLGLLEPDTDLRGLLLSVYTEQVAGFYDPDSTALFVMEDLSADTLESVLIHELVHAVQDQTADLDSLTAEDRGNDRQTAAQAAIEGHATLIMMEYMAESLGAAPFDIANFPDLFAALGPALEAMRDQYPALASAPAIIQESLFLPYLKGASFVAAFWGERGARTPPFGPDLPQSTEQILDPTRAFGPERDSPTELLVGPGEGYEILYQNSLGQMELEVLLAEHLGQEARSLAEGWDGDRYVLVAGQGGSQALLWASIWDETEERDRFLGGFEGVLASLAAPATLERLEVGGRPGALLRVGIGQDVPVSVREGPAR